jgi:two-component system, chemotaxis family, chemotaxis protein CheY
VLCDVNMPRSTGIEMLQKVQSTVRQRGIKFVMLTTEGQPGLIRQAKELGAAGWIVKPFNPGQLRALANKRVGAHPAASGSSRPVT